MKKLAMALAFLMSAGMVMAQASPGGQTPPGSGRGHRQMDPDRAADRLGKKLNLSADQVAQIKPILADQQQQMQALKADTSLSQEDKRAKGKQIMQDGRTKMEAVMTDQQKQQFEQSLQEAKSKRQARKGSASQPSPQ